MDTDRCGPYALEEKVGSGGMGTVYRARDTRSGERVAIKVVHPHVLHSASVFERLAREAKAGGRVDHENVVRTLEIAEDGGRHYLAMEFVEGKCLRTLLEEIGRVPETLLREIGRQVAAGLAAIHEQGVVHRDIKPENVMITAEHGIRVMDLGIARLMEPAPNLTRTGQFIGSLDYAAPEQCEGRTVGPTADLYALGVLLYELATGTNPFRRDTPVATMHAHLSHDPEAAATREPRVSRFLSNLIATLLAKAPDARPESAARVREILAAGESGSWWKAQARPARTVPLVPVSRATRLHGREPELARLGAAWERAAAGLGACVWIEGEPGIGKSRLLDELIRGVRDSEAHVLYGSFPPQGGAGGLTDAVRAIDATSLRAYLPDAPTLAAGLADPLLALPHDARQAAFSLLLQALAAERPTLWIVEDLHFADADTRHVAQAMARAATDHRALVVLTTRPHRLDAERANLRRLERFEEFTLHRLDAAEVGGLLEEALGDPGRADRLRDQIARRSDGVPMHVFELLRSLSGRSHSSVDTAAPPPALRDLIAARVAGLTPEERRLLDVAAVQGFEFDAERIGDVLGRPLVGVLQDLAELERREGLVRSEGRRFRFDHHQLQEVVYGTLPARLREEYHTLIAESMEGAAAVDVVRHQLKGRRPEDALDHLDAVLDELERAYRRSESLEILDAALGREGLLEGDARAGCLARKAWQLGALGRRDEQRAAAEGALALASDRAVVARVRFCFGSYWWQVGNLDEAHEHVVAALDTQEPRTVINALNTLGLIARRKGMAAEARQHFEDARALARKTGDPKLKAFVRTNLGLLLIDLGRREEARELLEQALGDTRAAGNRAQEAHAESTLGLLAWGHGDYAEAKRRLERVLEITRDAGSRRIEADAIGNMGLIHYEEGHLADARACLRKKIRIETEISSGPNEAIGRANLGLVLLQLGLTDEAAASCGAALALAREFAVPVIVGIVQATLGRIADQRGEPDEAEKAYRASLASFSDGTDSRIVAESVIGLARTLAARGEPEARSHLERALAMDLPSTHVEARAIWLMLPDGDVEKTQEALAAHGRFVSAFSRMEAHFRLAERTGDSTDLDEAKRLLSEIVRHAPAEHRVAMIENVPLHRAIRDA